MISSLLSILAMAVRVVLDIITLPFRAAIALLRGAEFEFRRFSRSGRRRV